MKDTAMSKISEHITYAEATKSETAIRHGILNKPDAIQLENMKFVAEKCFEPLRKIHGKPIKVSSFFRSKELNIKIGGASKSDHMDGYAIDIDADAFKNGISNVQIFEYLKANADFDKLIWEYGNILEPAWVHVSCRKKGNRKLIYRAKKVNGKTTYEAM